MTKALNRLENPGTISVLYVDDEPSNQLAMRAILSSQKDVSVAEALDEEDALDVLDEEDTLPDIVFMDQGLGHITGVEVRTSRGAVFTHRAQSSGVCILALHACTWLVCYATMRHCVHALTAMWMWAAGLAGSVATRRTAHLSFVCT